MHGSVKIEKDTLVTVLITNNQGIAKSKELYLGRYRIVEQKAPYGMTLNREPQIVELTYDGQSETVIFDTVSFENNRQKVQINLAKIMGIDEKFALGMNNEILNVKFGLFADENIMFGKSQPMNIIFFPMKSILLCLNTKIRIRKP